MAAPKEKKFGELEPQVSSYQPSPAPDELRPLDDAHGGIPVPHKIVEDNPARRFKSEPEHSKEYDFGKRKK